MRSLPKEWTLQIINKGKLVTKVFPEGEITSLPFMVTQAATERNPNDSVWAAVTRAFVKKNCPDMHPYSTFEVGHGDPLAIKGTIGPSRTMVPPAVSIRFLKLMDHNGKRHLPTATKIAETLVCVEAKICGPEGTKPFDLGFLAVHPGAFKVDLGKYTEPVIFHAKADKRSIWEPYFFMDHKDEHHSVALRLANEWGGDPEWGTPRIGQQSKSYFLTTSEPWQYGGEHGNSDQISLHLAVAPSPGFSETKDLQHLETAFRFRMIPVYT